MDPQPSTTTNCLNETSFVGQQTLITETKGCQQKQTKSLVLHDNRISKSSRQSSKNLRKNLPRAAKQRKPKGAKNQSEAKAQALAKKRERKEAIKLSGEKTKTGGDDCDSEKTVILKSSRVNDTTADQSTVKLIEGVKQQNAQKVAQMKQIITQQDDQSKEVNQAEVEKSKNNLPDPTKKVEKGNGIDNFDTWNQSSRGCSMPNQNNEQSQIENMDLKKASQKLSQNNLHSEFKFFMELVKHCISIESSNIDLKGSHLDYLLDNNTLIKVLSDDFETFAKTIYQEGRQDLNLTNSQTGRGLFALYESARIKIQDARIIPRKSAKNDQANLFFLQFQHQCHTEQMKTDVMQKNIYQLEGISFEQQEKNALFAYEQLQIEAKRFGTEINDKYIKNFKSQSNYKSNNNLVLETLAFGFIICDTQKQNYNVALIKSNVNAIKQALQMDSLCAIGQAPFDPNQDFNYPMRDNIDFFRQNIILLGETMSFITKLNAKNLYGKSLTIFLWTLCYVLSKYDENSRKCIIKATLGKLFKHFTQATDKQSLLMLWEEIPDLFESCKQRANKVLDLIHLSDKLQKYLEDPNINCNTIASQAQNGGVRKHMCQFITQHQGLRDPLKACQLTKNKGYFLQHHLHRCYEILQGKTFFADTDQFEHCVEIATEIRKIMTTVSVKWCEPIKDLKDQIEQFSNSNTILDAVSQEISTNWSDQTMRPSFGFASQDRCAICLKTFYFKQEVVSCMATSHSKHSKVNPCLFHQHCLHFQSSKMCRVCDIPSSEFICRHNLLMPTVTKNKTLNADFFSEERHLNEPDSLLLIKEINKTCADYQTHQHSQKLLQKPPPNLVKNPQQIHRDIHQKERFIDINQPIKSISKLDVQEKEICNIRKFQRITLNDSMWQPFAQVILLQKMQTPLSLLTMLEKMRSEANSNCVSEFIRKQLIDLPVPVSSNFRLFKQVTTLFATLSLKLVVKNERDFYTCASDYTKDIKEVQNFEPDELALKIMQFIGYNLHVFASLLSEVDFFKYDKDGTDSFRISQEPKYTGFYRYFYRQKNKLRHANLLEMIVFSAMMRVDVIVFDSDARVLLQTCDSLRAQPNKTFVPLMLVMAHDGSMIRLQDQKDALDSKHQNVGIKMTAAFSNNAAFYSQTPIKLSIQQVQKVNTTTQQLFNDLYETNLSDFKVSSLGDISMLYISHDVPEKQGQLSFDDILTFLNPSPIKIRLNLGLEKNKEGRYHQPVFKTIPTRWDKFHFTSFQVYELPAERIRQSSAANNNFAGSTQWNYLFEMLKREGFQYTVCGPQSCLPINNDQAIQEFEEKDVNDEAQTQVFDSNQDNTESQNTLGQPQKFEIKQTDKHGFESVIQSQQRQSQTSNIFCKQKAYSKQCSSRTETQSNNGI